jgi:thymidylate synthase
MIVFNSASQAFDFLATDQERWSAVPSRVGPTRETLAVQFTIRNPDEGIVLNPARRLDPHYLSAELLWYLSHRSDVAWLTPFAPSYSRFADPATGNAFGAYGKRLTVEGDPSCDLLDYACGMLKTDPYSRQAVIVLWRPLDLVVAHDGDCPDIPCTIAWQFILRDNRLHMVVTMRSNDLWLGLPYDIACFTSIQMLIASRLNVGLGCYTHQVGSLHAYERDWANLRAAAGASYTLPSAVAEDWTGGRYTDVLRQCIVAVEARDAVGLGTDSILYDAARCCIAKFDPSVAHQVRHPGLVRLLENRRGGV